MRLGKITNDTKLFYALLVVIATVAIAMIIVLSTTHRTKASPSCMSMAEADQLIILPPLSFTSKPFNWVLRTP